MLIFIFGEDQFNAKEKLAVMRKAFLTKFDSSGANLVDFPFKNSKGLDIGQIAQAIGSPPFISEKRMVIIKGLLSEVTRKPESKPWIEVLGSVPDSTIVILFDDIKSAKARKHAIVSNFNGHKDSHEYVFNLMNESEAVRWVLDRCKKIGLQISQIMSRKFVSMCGVDSWVLFSELDKLNAYCKGREVVQEDLDLLVRQSSDDQLFAFLDALSQRNGVRVKELLDEQRLFGTADQQLFGMLVRQIRLLIMASDYFEKNLNASEYEFAKVIGIHPFVAKKLTQQCKYFKKKELIEIQEFLMNSDLFVKNGVLKADQAVDLSIIPFLKL